MVKIRARIKSLQHGVYRGFVQFEFQKKHQAVWVETGTKIKATQNSLMATIKTIQIKTNYQIYAIYFHFSMLQCFTFSVTIFKKN